MNDKLKILFANVPGDGHFNPLTGPAVYLKSLGHDVRWYSSRLYSGKLEKLNIPHYPLTRALERTFDENDPLAPQRDKIGSFTKKLIFDLINVFVLRSPEYFEDIKDIRETFDFDVIICDCAFTAIPILRERFGVPVIALGVLPLIETSVDLFPTGLGLPPENTFIGRIKQSVLRFVADKILFRKPSKIFFSLLQKYGVTAKGSNLFDVCVRSASLFLQSGTPGFEYRRSDLGGNVRFIGPLLPHNSGMKKNAWSSEKLMRFKKVILVTQGTVEKDVNKLLVPALEAFKETDNLLVVTTGGSETKLLKEKYPHDNIIIEDFIDFNYVMPYTSVYITNGGYGGVMLSIMNEVPLVVAGINEGKNEVNARVGYFELGIDLKTESPTPGELIGAVRKVLEDTIYRSNVRKLRKEFDSYDANALTEYFVHEVLNRPIRRKRRPAEIVY